MSLIVTLKIVAALLVLVVVIFVLSLFELYTQLGRYKAYWLNNNQHAIQMSDQVYVAFGDSAAQGVGATSPKKGYVSLVAEGLSKDKGPIRTINLSKSGGKVKDVLDTQLPEFERLKLPKDAIITVEIGANDMLAFEPQKFEKEMDTLMSRLPKQAVISDIPFFGGTRFKKVQADVVVANEIMYRLAEKHGFVLAELHRRVQANTGPRTLAVDWFHPSNYAYQSNWAPAFLDILVPSTEK